MAGHSKTSIAVVAALLALAAPARADDAPPPCSMPVAVALADRPGTGRTTSSGGSPCVVVTSEAVIELLDLREPRHRADAAAFARDEPRLRHGPVLPAGSRAFVALQRAIGNRLAVDVDYEVNLAPSAPSHATAVGFGFVWIAAPGHR